ncbi:adenylosuccinate lyase family protein [Acidocella sp.]|uniref:class-II fumarase/aspartase family protein n=1 Tax=Acidocella sp. TaxID=50710 RepID=UPI00261C2D27|nr:adenylosuccinate lyase family protein [Acidocella sp.]
MPSTAFDSALFRDMFGTPEMRAIFSDEALIGRYLEAETALARAQAGAGLFPAAAALAITNAAQTMVIDYDKLRHETEIVGYPILSLVHQLATASGDAGGFVHWGATTQDIMDTATVLQIRAALLLIGRELDNVRAILISLAAKHRDTVMAGRTHLQHALPVTFGYKVAVWLSSLNRHAERLNQALPRILMGEFAGAAGTLASIPEKGLEIQKRFCDELGLHQPPIAWHVARDGIAEAVTLLGLITGSLAKIATDVMLMATTEFGEVSEPFVPGRGASSTMPQKRNPISCELMLAAAKSVRQHVAAMLDGMIHDFERATGPWHVEWVSLPESFLLTASSLANAKFMLAGLVVHEARMRQNLDITHGLIVAESVMMAAAPRLGRQKAHDVIYNACRQAIEQHTQLADILLQIPEIIEALGTPEAVRQHCEPTKYLGLAGQMVDRMIATTTATLPATV